MTFITTQFLDNKADVFPNELYTIQQTNDLYYGLAVVVPESNEFSESKEFYLKLP